MAEPVNPPADGGTGAPVTPPNGADPDKTEKGDGKGAFDTSKLSDDDLAKLYDDPRLYNHPRFKDLAEKAKLAKTLQAEKKAAEDAALKEKGEWEKIAKKREGELTQLQEKIKQSTVDSAIKDAAVKKGIQDLDAALKLIDKSKVIVNDDGTIVGVAEAVDALAKERSYLLTVNRSTIGSPTNPGNPDAGITKFTISQISDPVFYRKNEAAIKKAQLTGQIVEDRR